MARHDRAAEDPRIPARLRFARAAATTVVAQCSLCDAIEAAVLDGSDALDPLLARWHASARRVYEPVEFKTYYGAMTTEEFVRDALAPNARYVADLTYDEARAVLAAVCEARLPPEETSYYLRLLELNLPGANVSDLLYWPDQWFADKGMLQVDLTHEQMLGYAMARSGRRLPGAPDGVVLPYPAPPRE